MSLTLGALAAEIGGSLIRSDGSEVITAVAYDSRRVKQGNIFAAISGFQVDGAKFIEDAIAGGARAVICEAPRHESFKAPAIIVPNAREAMARAAWGLAGHPEKKLKLVAATGTNGKTTVATGLANLLSSLDTKCGVCGTLGMFFEDVYLESERTTAEAPELAQAIAQMATHGCKAVTLEATSIGLALHRMAGLSFDVVAFTNLTRDHLDFHGSWEAYREAKLALFNAPMNAGVAVINIDDPEALHFTQACAGKAFTYGLNEAADFRADNAQLGPSGSSFTLHFASKKHEVQTRLIGHFNIYNALAIIASAHALGFPIAQIVEMISTVTPVRGRAEAVISSAPFTVIIDYAHTPDALIKILSTMRNLTRSKLRCIVGAGGDRDRGKRPLMARAAEENCDALHLTSDNPRTEDPNAILDDMRKGLSNEPAVRVNPDRRTAIAAALSDCKPGDVLIIAGKGHETYQEIHGVKYPFDDREIAQEWLRDHGYSK
jgi:UDP-N-acetylmuramoyl-L-alanyl-D-glutamate--2,6-diaminopimelate ligase